LIRPFLLLIVLLAIAACDKPPANDEMVFIPSSEFLLGHSASKEIPAFLSETTTGANAQPMQKYHLDSFYLDRYEVKYGDFIKFKPLAKYKDGSPDEPIRGVSWYEADSYCLSIGKRLPTEFEWEKAARGVDGRMFVWGNKFDQNAANLEKVVKNVGSMEKDKSHYGVYDLNGNVSEWTSSWYLPYPESVYDDKNYGKKFKVTRGGAINKRKHGFMKEFAKLPYRNYVPRKIRSWDTGFRCAKSK
jgi:formylglycine-generating enzyme required for sulfatase activity